MITPEKILNDFQARLATIPDKKEQVAAIIDFGIIYGDSFGEKIISLLEQGITISKTINFSAGELILNYNVAFFQGRTKGDSNLSKNLTSAPLVREMIEKVKDDPYWYSLGLNLLSYFYWFQGEYEKGFNTIFDAIKISEKDEKNPINHAWHHYALGVFYFDTRDIDSSGFHYQRAHELFDKIGYKYGKARAGNGIASVHINKREIENAYPFIEYSISVYREMAHYSGLSRSLNDLALIEKEKGNYENAIQLFEESIDLRKKIDHAQGLVTSLTEQGEIYLLLKDYDKALHSLTEGLVLSQKIKSKQKELRLHKLLSDLYKKTNNVQSALDHFEEFYRLKTELMGDEASHNIKKLQTKFEKEHAEKEAEIQRLKNVELKRAYELIEQHNKDIKDSINYAKRIQRAILAKEEDILIHFPESFLLYLPKDIVAGDFYFFETTGTHLFYAAADCTGHGVPGALVSVICSNALTRSIKEFGITEPGKILDKTCELVLETFKKSGSDVKDGMDISLLVKEVKTGQYQWAGANNPLWYIQKGKLEEIKPTKRPIGFSEHTLPFVTHQLKLNKGDMVYLFTDGYADQFGGHAGKKFKPKQFAELALHISSQNCHKQKELIHKAFNDWKGNLEQVDDVCVIGIKI